MSRFNLFLMMFFMLPISIALAIQPAYADEDKGHDDEQMVVVGPQGPTGLTGLAGAPGAQGPVGLTGAAGATGAAGSAGPAGPQGSTGLTGATGSAGPPGADGSPGPQGIAGNDGALGAQGLIGLTGAAGPQGPIGLTGSAGADGTNGVVGAVGATGPAGPQGIQGVAGSQGPAGTSAWAGGSGQSVTMDSIGIGTNNPTEKLDVVGNIHASGTLRSGNSIIIDGISDTITASGGTISFDNENLITTGRVGIGVLSPQSALQVNGTVKATDFEGALKSGTDGTNGLMMMIWAGNAASNGGSGGAISITSGGGWNNVGGALTLNAGNHSSWSPVGTHTDATINGGTVDGFSKASLRVEGGSVAVSTGPPQSNGGNVVLSGGVGTGSNRNGGNIILNPGAATGSGNLGNVGIGVSAPSNILTVQQGSVTDPIADSWQVYSSRRYKTDIHTMQQALSKVLQLRGVTYKGKIDGQDNIGLIAEEVGKIVPQVVAYEANGKDARSVDYARLVALLVEAVKEQQTTIETMQQRLDVAESASHLSVSSLLERVRQLETHAGIQADTGKQLSSR